MKIISRLRDQRYCAFCRSPRRLYVKKHVDLTNVVGMMLLALTSTHAYWGRPDPRGLILFCVFISGAEIFVYMRWRASVVCRLCGFDPVVYKRSPEQASKLVKQFFAEQAANPRFLLSKSPLLELHRQRVERERKLKSRRSSLAPEKTL
ncbi:MAG: hypothetical protein AB7G93_14865 [Bdellovibrionales bacterium]